MAIREYMARLDADPESVLDLFEPDLEFLIVIPTGPVRGESRDAFADYVTGGTGRRASGRVHHVLHEMRDGDLEVVNGYVTEHGEPKGEFVASARLSPAGKVQRYLAYFDTTFLLMGGPEPDSG